MRFSVSLRAQLRQGTKRALPLHQRTRASCSDGPRLHWGPHRTRPTHRPSGREMQPQHQQELFMQVAIAGDRIPRNEDSNDYDR